MLIKNPVEQTIIKKLTTEFAPSVLNIENESYMHSSGRGAESHFKVTMVSTLFEGLSSVGRHRAVYSILSKELENGVHALVLHLFTPDEWLEAAESVPASPNCVGIGR